MYQVVVKGLNTGRRLSTHVSLISGRLSVEISVINGPVQVSVMSGRLYVQVWVISGRLDVVVVFLHRYQVLVQVKKMVMESLPIHRCELWRFYSLHFSAPPLPFLHIISKCSHTGEEGGRRRVHNLHLSYL